MVANTVDLTQFDHSQTTPRCARGDESRGLTKNLPKKRIPVDLSNVKETCQVLFNRGVLTGVETDVGTVKTGPIGVRDGGHVNAGLNKRLKKVFFTFDGGRQQKLITDA